MLRQNLDLHDDNWETECSVVFLENCSAEYSGAIIIYIIFYIIIEN